MDNIYNYLKIHFDIKNINYIFKRDYIINPLQKIGKSHKLELPYKEDLEYLYIQLNLTKSQLCQLFNIKTVNNILKSFNIYKPKNLIIENTNKSIQEKYGCYYFQTDEFKSSQPKHKSQEWKDSQRINNISKYGVENVFQLNDIKEKSKQTCLEKYGAEYYVQSDTYKKLYNDKKWVQNIQEKSYITRKQTCLEKYGNEYYNNSKQTKLTNLERYGVKCPLQNSLIKEQSEQTKLEKYGNKNYLNIEKRKQTCLKKYGAEYFSQSNDFKKLYKDKSFLNNVKSKEFATKKKNNSFSTSSAETIIFELLKSKYQDVIHQYRSKKYPFNCDFYIPEIDTYIEYQGSWHHRKEPYIGTDEQKEIVEKWHLKSLELNFQGKEKKQYKRAIKIWTIEDPLKRKTAKDNNLNWLEFFDMNQFMEWYNNKKEE